MPMDAERLAVMPIFDSLDLRQRQSLALAMNEKSYLPGEAVFSQGDKAWSCYVVIEGQVEVRGRAGEEAERALAMLHEGELFGEVALLDGGRRSASCVAGPEGAALAELGRPEFDMIFNAGNQFAYRLMDLVAAQLVRRLRHASAQLAEAAVKEGWEGRDDEEG
ncbi:MAG: cyclic nucleotide-binding domain-containing protein [Myxococcales bacterium]|nr:cyclic nucleotide-binding domain-containing protein [Myxococcales bacterium]MCB9539030.1 cyclic nucleotide-binding domain-containing protein [Myxococcales bacterium]